MRFNNDDYLKAFPREERAATTMEKTIVKDEPGDVFDDKEEAPARNPETIDPEAEGGAEDGGE